MALLKLPSSPGHTGGENWATSLCVKQAIYKPKEKAPKPVASAICLPKMCRVNFIYIHLYTSLALIIHSNIVHHASLTHELAAYPWLLKECKYSTHGLKWKKLGLSNVHTSVFTIFNRILAWERTPPSEARFAATWYSEQLRILAGLSQCLRVLFHSVSTPHALLLVN